MYVVLVVVFVALLVALAVSVFGGWGPTTVVRRRVVSAPTRRVVEEPVVGEPVDEVIERPVRRRRIVR